jgi:FkbH-like protein
MTDADVRGLSAAELLQKQKRLRRELLEQGNLQDVRIAVLGGVTTSEVVALLELLLLANGFRPAFHQSEYNRYYEDAVLQPEAIKAFAPDIVYVHTHVRNVQNFPRVGSSEEQFRAAVAAEAGRFDQVWTSLQTSVGAQIIQNNFENPPLALFGNLDGTVPSGRTRYVRDLNREFALVAANRRGLLIQDLNALSAEIGHARWFDWERWYGYKILTTPAASLAIAASLSSMIGAMLGRTKKCLVVDLDNTLWGGVIGDDGLDRIRIGRETPVAEAFTALQEYVLSLRDRGILLAVCSKNEMETALSGFTHPESVLKAEHFSAFKANWDPKPDNIRAIAEELNIGLDALVFLDDNPAERAIVSAQLPMVAVPDVGSEVALYPELLQKNRYFEAVSLSTEDLARAESYAANAGREQLQARFADYGEYLQSLQMSAEIDAFRSVYLERITQLINKTNQFNLTTRRYTQAEIDEIAASPDYVGLYGKLADTFGDNGLISVIIGHRLDRVLHIDLWIMSCRVLKRDMELAMLDALVERACALDVEQLRGLYRPTAKNAMVADHYRSLGFERTGGDESGATEWTLAVTGYTPRNRHIQTRTPVHG